MRIVKTLIFVFTVLIVIDNCGEREILPVRPEQAFTAVKTAESPVIDGILNDTCWNGAESAVLVLSGDGGRPVYPTTVRSAWDDENLYIGFECQDTDAASTVTVRDALMSGQEYISVYIDADADSITYAAVDIAPTGVVSDAFILNNDGSGTKKKLSGWNCDGIRVSVSVYGGGARPDTEDRFWTVEAALPFREFLTARRLPPMSGDMWRVSFHRVELTGVNELSTLVPTGDNAGRNTVTFGWLLFGG